MKEEAISSSGNPLLVLKSTSPPPNPTPAASSAGASSPAVPVNAGSIDWLGHAQGSKAGSLSHIDPQPLRNSLSTSAGGSALGSSQPSCRPWERGDLLRRLSTFKPANWFGKPKAASSSACARRGWVNVCVDKIECESCSANLHFISSALWTPTEADGAAEDFAKQLDVGHKVSCPWRGNSCAESLVQFPPAPPSALIGGYKDRCDGLLQFLSLPVVAASAIEQMRVSRDPEIERFLVHTLAAGESGIRAEIISEKTSEEALHIYSNAQKLISLCGWEPRWLPNIQDCEEHSAQSARNGCSIGPTGDHCHLQDAGPSKKTFSASTKNDYGQKEVVGFESKSQSLSPLLDCTLCGATVRIWDFLTISRPARFAPTSIDIPETSKKMALTRGVSAASGISGWIATDGMAKEQTEDRDEAATTDEGKSQSNVGVDLNLTMGGGLSSTQLHLTMRSEQYQDASMGRDLVMGQPSSSDIGDRAASYESRGPSKRKWNLYEGGSTVDRPHLIIRQADSIEGTVIDRDGDEVDDGREYSAGPSKRARVSDLFETYASPYRRVSPEAGPSYSLGFDIEADAHRVDPFPHGNEQIVGLPSATRYSTHASSVIAMDTFYHNADDDSMESVENYPGDVDDIHFPSMAMFRHPDLNETSELNYSNPAQESTCPATLRIGREIVVSSTNDGEEVLNTDTTTAHGMDVPSFAISGGSVGMGASHEAEIHGTDVSVHRSDSVVGDVEPVAEVTDNQGQTGEFGPDPGLMGDFVPEEIDHEDPHGDSQDVMFRPVGRADSGSKILGSAKAESVDSEEKTNSMNILPQENITHPSFSCNAIVCSGPEASKEEVTQAGKASPAYDCEPNYLVSNGIGPPNVESNSDETVDFDPLKHHNSFCPWVNGNVAAAGCGSSSGSSSSAGVIALCGWQLTLDALDTFQSLGHLPIQTVESESAASLYKDDHLTSSRKLLPRHSFSKSRGRN